MVIYITPTKLTSFPFLPYLHQFSSIFLSGSLLFILMILVIVGVIMTNLVFMVFVVGL